MKIPKLSLFEIQWIVERLPTKQARLFRLLLSDKPLKEVALEMGNAKQTVDVQSHTIYKKFGVGNRLGLILACLADPERIKALDL